MTKLYFSHTSSRHLCPLGDASGGSTVGRVVFGAAEGAVVVNAQRRVARPTRCLCLIRRMLLVGLAAAWLRQGAGGRSHSTDHTMPAAVGAECAAEQRTAHSVRQDPAEQEEAPRERWRGGTTGALGGGSCMREA